jgi:hypothetical protein
MSNEDQPPMDSNYMPSPDKEMDGDEYGQEQTYSEHKMGDYDHEDPRGEGNQEEDSI